MCITIFRQLLNRSLLVKIADNAVWMKNFAVGNVSLLTDTIEKETTNGITTTVEDVVTSMETHIDTTAQSVLLGTFGVYS